MIIFDVRKRFLFDVEQYPKVCEPKVNSILSLIFYFQSKSYAFILLDDDFNESVLTHPK